MADLCHGNTGRLVSACALRDLLVSRMNEDIPLQSPDNRPIHNLERLTPAPARRADMHWVVYLLLGNLSIYHLDSIQRDSFSLLPSGSGRKVLLLCVPCSPAHQHKGFPWFSCRCCILKKKLCTHNLPTGTRGERSQLIILSDSSQTRPQHSDCHNF